MKRHKLIAIACLVLLFVGSSCKKQHYFKYSGSISGEDKRMCACCGGHFINIDGDTLTYLAHALPAGTDLSNESYPVHIEFNATFKNFCGTQKIIEIQNMKKR
jgi:hypothetical protein